MSAEYKNIYFRLWNPQTARFTKTTNKDRAESTVIQCSNSENCDLFKRGQCNLITLLFSNGGCPYGKSLKDFGPTKNSKGVFKWVQEKGELYKGVPGNLTYPSKKLAVIGDYVLLPYSHIEMNKNVPFLVHSGFMFSGSPILNKSDFNISNLQSIVNFLPQALFGGETTSYQKDFKDKWYWNGAALEFKGDINNFLLFANVEDGNSVRSVNSCEATVTPTDKTCVKITDNSQVDSSTVFVD